MAALHAAQNEGRYIGGRPGSSVTVCAGLVPTQMTASSTTKVQVANAFAEASADEASHKGHAGKVALGPPLFDIGRLESVSAANAARSGGADEPK